MKNILTLLTIFIIGFVTISAVNAKQADIKLRNNLFAISLPQELRKTYSSKIKNDYILIYHTESKKAGFGGLVFGVKAYKNPADHAEMPGGRKIGELRGRKSLWNKTGTLYDIVLIQPTDVQYDYTKTEKAPESYQVLYNLGNRAEFNIVGVNGSVYYKNQGMKGKNLYKDVLKKHITAINEKWDSIKLEKENMSPMYNVISASGENAMKKMGYTYYDVNGDGIEELLIGEIAEGEWKGIVYDMYTMVDRYPRHVMSGWSRNRFFACNGTFVCNEYSSGAKESGMRVYILVENSTELFPQVNFKYDGYKNQNNPWFLSYGDGTDDSKWENVSEEAYNDRKRTFESYNRFDFIPLINFANECDDVTTTK